VDTSQAYGMAPEAELSSNSPPWLRHWSSMLVLGLLIIVAWQVPWLNGLVYPFRLFGTFVHELSHGFAAILTGGDFQRFEVQPDLSGVAWSAGGVRMLVASAGYVGSAVAGGLIILLYQRWLSSRVLLIALGVSLALLCLLFVRNFFGVTAGLGLAALLLLAGLRLGASWRDTLLITLALQLILDGYNSLFTVLSLSTGSSAHTDAHTMAQLTFVPAVVWVLIWMGLSTFILYHALRWSFARNGSVATTAFAHPNTSTDLKDSS
jgi:hypothetical protein